MDKRTELTNDEKWHAVVSCDSACDGLFLYGVKTTGIVCHPSCKSKTPLRSNVIFFDDYDEAIRNGFRVCKRCNPDKAFVAPGLVLVNEVMDFLHENYENQIDIKQISKKFGVSTNYLSGLFKKNCGVTPKQYISDLRLKKSLELLEDEDRDLLEIIELAGFNSVSNFYKQFKKKMGYPPNQYRKINK